LSEANGGPPAWRRLLARALVVGGVALIVALFAPALPREQVFVLRVGPGARRIEASFTREGERVPVNTVKLAFPTSAPSRVRHVLSLPNGRYVVRVEVDRGAADSHKETSYVRRVTLSGGETELPLDGPE
jgi:hypothetical protein